MPGQGSHSLHRHLDLLGTAVARGREGGKGRPLPFSTHMKSALQAINPLCSPEPCPEALASSRTALPPEGRLEDQRQRSYWWWAMLSLCPAQPLSHC